MKPFIYLLFVILFLFSGCQKSTWEKVPGGVVVSPAKNKNAVRLLVVNEDIFHVVSAPNAIFRDSNSLSVLPRESVFTDFRISEEKDTLRILTSHVMAKISLTDGSVMFCDTTGAKILKEKSGTGRGFQTVRIEDMNVYEIHQVFDSPDEEAIYGLGQHQSDEFNYKGLNEELYQYNTKVSVPFLISDRNYGILWDNYSLTKFGDKRDYAGLDQFNLYNIRGEAGGLSALYYVNSDSSRLFVERKEASIDYENLESVKNFPEGFPFGNSSITWQGSIEPSETGLYHFRLYYAGYVKFFVNEELIVPERWRTAWNPNTYKFRLELEKGRKYPVRLEWKPDGGVSYIGLKALGPRLPEDQNALSLYSEAADQIDYYFIHGKNMDDVISGYRELTGKAPIMPKWSMGYWQSRERYKTAGELTGVIEEYRRRHIPIDNIVLDWFYWPEDSWGSHEFDPLRFPDPEGMVKKVHELNARIMISVWPKFYHTTDHYKEFESRGWMYTRAVKDSIRDWVGKGYIGSFYDAYNKDARKLFWDQMSEHIYNKEFDAWWMDASEPDIQSNSSIQYRKELMTPTALGPSAKYFNAYALMNAEAIFNGQRAEDPDKRVFLLTRSGFAGLQRYSTATWSGDIGTRWEDMKAQISAGLNFSLSGIPYWTMDIGGFCVENRYFNAVEGSPDREEWRELNNRWYQFGAFCPLFRSHGQFPYREIYNISGENHPAYKSMVYVNKLRYRLMPYIYSLAAMTYYDDYTIMRAMIMDFPYDKSLRNTGDQYMFGPSILVAPVYQYGARSRMVRFPSRSGWYNFYSGEYIEGGQFLEVNAPYERIPLFVRRGSVIPAGPDIEYSGGRSPDEITLFVYTGEDGSFTLYDDEGVNYNYEKGQYSKIPIHYIENEGKLVIGDRTGTFDGMPVTMKFNINWVSREIPVGFDPNRKPDIKITYSGKSVEIRR